MSRKRTTPEGRESLVKKVCPISDVDGAGDEARSGFLVTFRFVDPYDNTYERSEVICLLLQDDCTDEEKRSAALCEIQREYPDLSYITIESLVPGAGQGC